MWYYLIIAFSGLIFGINLARITKDELKDGKKYFILLEKLIIFVLIIFLLYNVSFNLGTILSFIMGFFVFYKLNKIYFYLGLVLILGYFLSETILISFSALIFIFGLAYGTLLYSKKSVKFWTWDFIYFLIPLILLFINNFIVTNIDYFLTFVSGSLFCSVLNRKL